jgi:5'-nucleotidase
MPKEHQRGEVEIDFSTAAYFTGRFAQLMLHSEEFPDVDVLKIDVPSDATRETPWRLTRLSRSQYYVPLSPARQHFDESVRVDFEIRFDEDKLEPDSDVYAVRVAREVSVTPLSLDMTARVDFGDLENRLRSSDSGV